MHITEEIGRLKADSLKGFSSSIATMFLRGSDGAAELEAAVRTQADPPLPDAADLSLEARRGQVCILAQWDEPPLNKRRRSCDVVYRAFDVTGWADGTLTEVPPQRARVEGMGRSWKPAKKTGAKS